MIVTIKNGVLRTFTIELPWPPTGNHATKHTRTGGHYKTAQASSYRAQVQRILRDQGVGSPSGAEALQGPLAVDWILAPPDRRARDMDNVRKEAADALTLAGLWADDSCKVIRREIFEWTDPVPGGRLLVSVSEMAA